MIVIIDYGAGNLQSVKKALDFIGAPNRISKDAGQISSASHLILPGVGSFGDAMACMERSGLTDTVRRAALSGKPFLGICLGMHLLFDSSEESPGVKGLGILPGRVKKFASGKGLKVPHMGWNSIHLTQENGVFSALEGRYFYFVHSYYICADRAADVAASCDYGITFQCAVQRGNLCATQFHPEKSAQDGLTILRNFAKMGEV